CQNIVPASSWMRCLDCLPDGTHGAKCATCLVEEHSAEPFHRVERWNGRFWCKVTLNDLGLIVNLGHGRGESCAVPSNVRELQVIDINGIFITKVRFCGCVQSSDHLTEPFIQLLRARWFPCTIAVPSTAVTFRCLDAICRLNNQGKLTGYDYYQSQVQATDSAELDPPKV
ncbi:hypothetical protein SCHPADRAFT_796130, partial [Schizopora paradoxa]